MRDRARPEYLQALERDSRRFEIVHLTEVGRPVIEARNRLAARAQEAATEGDYIVWIDDDAWWRLGTLDGMIATLDKRSDIDILSGYFGGRDHFTPAFAWRGWDDEEPNVDPGRNCELGEVVEIAKTGFHFILMRRTALATVGSEAFSPAHPGMSDDTSFYSRAKYHGLRMFIDTGAWIAHIGSNGDAYFVGHPRGRIVNGEVVLSRTFEMPSGPRNVERRMYGLPEMERSLAASDTEAYSRKAAESKRMPRPVRDTRAAAEWIAQRESNCARLADRAK